MDLRPFYPLRPDDARKGDFGRVLVVGGSERYAGACAFNALAALRCGADLSYVLAPRRAADLVASYGPDLITIPCDGAFPTLAEAREFLPAVDALVVGGGVERSDAAHRALRDLMRAAEVPMVVDAEALRALSAEPDLVRGKRALLTPHGGEYEALAGSPWPADERAREDACARLAARYGVTVIVKGRREVISDGDRIARDEAGSSYLTKGGYGDLLAGAAGAMVARGHSPFDAARVAAFVVGSAGALAARELGESTVASDALARVPDVLRAALTGTGSRNR